MRGIVHHIVIDPRHRELEQPSSLIAIVVLAIVSILAVGFFLLYVSWVSLHAFLERRGIIRGGTWERSFFRTQLGAYTVSLLMSNFIMSIGFIINVRWVELKRVDKGSLCTAQGALTELANTATAYFTAAIAVHVFNSLVCHHKLPAWFCGFAVVSGWVISLIISVIPLMIKNAPMGPIYAFGGISCGISKYYPAVRVLFRLIPVFFAIVISIVFYFMIYLILRGTLDIQQGLHINLREDMRMSIMSNCERAPGYRKFIVAVVKSMIWYPGVYGFLSLPSMVVDLMQVADDPVPFGLHVFGDAFLALLGSANSLILLNTLRLLSPYLLTSCNQDNGSIMSDDSNSFYAGQASPLDGMRTFATPDLSEKDRIGSKRGSDVESLTEMDMPVLVISPVPPVYFAAPRDKHFGSTVSLPNMSPTGLLDGVPSSDKTDAATIHLPSYRPITPVSVLNALVSPPTTPNEPESRRSGPTSNRERPLPSLPAPPRRTRSPVARQPSVVDDGIPASNSIHISPASANPPIASSMPQDATADSILPARRDTLGAEIPPRPFPRPSMEAVNATRRQGVLLSPPTMSSLLSPPSSRATSVASSFGPPGLPSNPRAYKALYEQQPSQGHPASFLWSDSYAGAQRGDAVAATGRVQGSNRPMSSGAGAVNASREAILGLDPNLPRSGVDPGALRANISLPDIRLAARLGAKPVGYI
ncbi:hypothetical protein POSPLADRAFT_1060187 [Postia placenta MAD-698-R-SB12]|uniref:Glucose receptor Git3 N-terminal domain-containing protein n=1 Tax=Postia placenta MAD-698-R-SB12 TaxID=670580 RepID=A0A1X6MRU2_9APHY|nr:hypothetical protein POSPLADRAFT_1060187 [Postia placenta MAD-698-R-SB12]OSX59101.1 hypothetical protein POSPLADRAFT_1060187 [Postia placenta MAD-698-R-SB12]